jgi:hypothetical protein
LAPSRRQRSAPWRLRRKPSREDAILPPGWGLRGCSDPPAANRTVSEDPNDACFILKIGPADALASYVYYEDNRDGRSAANLMTKDEARRVAANVAKLRTCWAARTTKICAAWAEPKKATCIISPEKRGGTLGLLAVYSETTAPKGSGGVQRDQIHGPRSHRAKRMDRVNSPLRHRKP